MTDRSDNQPGRDMPERPVKDEEMEQAATPGHPEGIGAHDQASGEAGNAD